MLGDKYNEDEVEARFGLKTTLARETIVQEQENRFVKFQLPNTNNYVKEDLINYLRPLIQGEVKQIYKNGLPQHISLKK